MRVKQLKIVLGFFCHFLFSLFLEKQIRDEFEELKVLFDGIKLSYFRKDDYFKEVSMGMSSDYKIAVEEGSTMVRIGSNIFGKRKKTSE